MQEIYGDGYSTSVVTTDNTLTNVITKDISLLDVLGIETLNFQRWKMEIMAFNNADSLEMLSENFEFGVRWNGESADFITLPASITPFFSERMSPECDDWTITISADGNNVVVDVTGVVDKTIQWYIFTTQVISFDF